MPLPPQDLPSPPFAASKAVGRRNRCSQPSALNANGHQAQTQPWPTAGPSLPSSRPWREPGHHLAGSPLSLRLEQGGDGSGSGHRHQASGIRHGQGRKAAVCTGIPGLWPGVQAQPSPLTHPQRRVPQSQRSQQSQKSRFSLHTQIGSTCPGINSLPGMSEGEQKLSEE